MKVKLNFYEDAEKPPSGIQRRLKKWLLENQVKLLDAQASLELVKEQKTTPTLPSLREAALTAEFDPETALGQFGAFGKRIIRPLKWNIHVEIDSIHLVEYEEIGEYTGREVIATVTFSEGK
jgi:hypothetical protein